MISLDAGGLFLSTLSLRRATVTVLGIQHRTGISIHALLAESDDVACGYWHKLHHFYPRSPCGERPGTSKGVQGQLRISIHALLAESDGTIVTAHTWQGDFYPRSPCGERLSNTICFESPICISIHALLAESDVRHSCNCISLGCYFYPRSPCGERQHTA